MRHSFKKDKKKLRPRVTKQWRCSECGDIDKICPHLALLLPKEVVHHRTYYKPDMAVYRDPGKDYEKTAEELSERLAEFGLEPFRAKIMVLRFVYDMTFEDIAEEMMLQSAQSAHYIYQTTVDFLREAGYE